MTWPFNSTDTSGFVTPGNSISRNACWSFASNRKNGSTVDTCELLLLLVLVVLVLVVLLFPAGVMAALLLFDDAVLALLSNGENDDRLAYMVVDVDAAHNNIIIRRIQAKAVRVGHRDGDWGEEEVGHSSFRVIMIKVG